MSYNEQQGKPLKKRKTSARIAFDANGNPFVDMDQIEEFYEPERLDKNAERSGENPRWNMEHWQFVMSVAVSVITLIGILVTVLG